MGLSALRDKLLAQAKSSKQSGPSPIAIDFGTGSLKMLQVTTTETGSTLLAAAALETPEDLLHDPAKRLLFQADAIGKLMKTGGFRGKRAVCAIPASLSFCKHMRVDRVPGASVREIVEAGLVQQFGCHPSQMVFRHFEVADVPKTGGGTQIEVICLAATRELVSRLMGAISAAKLDPVGMHCEQLALMKAFDPIARRSEDKLAATLYLDIGAGSTNMLIAHGRTLVFSKRVEMGGRFLDDAICKQTKCEFEEARTLRRKMDGIVLVEKQEPVGAGARAGAPGRPLLTPGGTIPMSGSIEEADARGEALQDMATSRLSALEPGERRNDSSAVFSGDVTSQPQRAFVPPKADLGEALEIMTDDIALALRYYQTLFPSKPIERAVFVGGEARYKGLCQHIARAIRVSAQVADPLAYVARNGNETTPGVDLRQAQPGWAVPLGLCLLPTDL